MCFFANLQKNLAFIAQKRVLNVRRDAEIDSFESAKFVINPFSTLLYTVIAEIFLSIKDVRATQIFNKFQAKWISTASGRLLRCSTMLR